MEVNKSVYKHSYINQYLLRLVKIRDNGVNVFLEVDEINNPIVKPRPWSVRPQEQKHLVQGFDVLSLYKTFP